VSSIAIESLRKTWPDGHVALEGIELEVADGELVVLVGPSGCGKSTLLRCVAGLEEPSAGRVLLDGEDVTHCSPRERDLAMVFQSYALYPHKSVYENLAFGLRMRRVARAEIELRVREAAETLGLGGLLERRPAQLSGGQRQRVALGRALVREPRAFLLDEPLSNLDARLRVEMRAEIARLHRRTGATMLYVTHDQEEAMTLGDRLAVLRDGRLEQVATPAETWRRPATAFVAGFIGSPPMNLLRGRLAAGDAPGRGRLLAPGVDAEGPVATPDVCDGRGALLGLRPHDLVLAPRDACDAVVRVDAVQMLGSARLLLATLGEGPEAQPLTVALEGEPRTAGEAEVRPGEAVGVRFDPERAHLFDAASGARLD